MSSTARPVEPTAPEMATTTGRAYDEAQVKKTDQALGAWRDAFEQHHEEQIALEAERLANKPALAPWFLAGASGLSLLVAMVAVVARVVAPPSTVSAVSVAPIEEITVEPPSVEVAPALPMVEATPAPAEPAARVETAPVAAPIAAQAGLEIVGTPRTWESGGYRWVSFDAKTDGPMQLAWLDASGKPALDERTCGFFIGDGTRRCVVGRSDGRVGAALAAGAEPGTWRIEACADGGCAQVATIDVAR